MTHEDTGGVWTGQISIAPRYHDELINEAEKTGRLVTNIIASRVEAYTDLIATNKALVDVVQQFINGIETESITTEMPEILQNVMGRARAALKLANTVDDKPAWCNCDPGTCNGEEVDRCRKLDRDYHVKELQDMLVSISDALRVTVQHHPDTVFLFERDKLEEAITFLTKGDT